MVFADTNRYAGVLAGKYVGATAGVSFAAGLVRRGSRRNVLVDGSHRTVALQPLSVQGQWASILSQASASSSCIPPDRLERESSSRGLDVGGA